MTWPQHPDTAEWVERIRAKQWGWRRAFDAWHHLYGGVPDLAIQDDGTRVVLRDATQFIQTNPDWLQAHEHIGYGGIVQDDGTLHLDTAGVYRYRPLGDLDWGFTAYERIPA
jgi:hypothetical protein